MAERGGMRVCGRLTRAAPEHRDAFGRRMTLGAGCPDRFGLLGLRDDGLGVADEAPAFHLDDNQPHTTRARTIRSAAPA